MVPYGERIPDTQYQDLLRLILEHGEEVQTQQGEPALTLFPPPMNLHYDLSKGFPMITERNMDPKTSERLPVTIWQQAIGEILAFINGATTQEQLEKFGCFWWKDWLTPTKCQKRGLPIGSNGPCSYGGAFHDFPTANGGFNQFEEVIEEIKDNPDLRTHFISPWIPNGIPRRRGRQQQVVVAPCHGWIHIRIINGRLDLHMIQRSADVPIGVPSNIIQYAALTLALAQVLGYRPGYYSHSFSDAHIYVGQIPAVEKMLSRTPKPFPTMTINSDVTNLFDFRREHFTLSDYHPHPGITNIPVAI